MHLALSNHFECKIQKVFDPLVQCGRCNDIEYVVRFFGLSNKFVDQMKVGTHGIHGVQIHLKVAQTAAINVFIRLLSQDNFVD